MAIPKPLVASKATVPKPATGSPQVSGSSAQFGLPAASKTPAPIGTSKPVQKVPTRIGTETAGQKPMTPTGQKPPTPMGIPQGGSVVPPSQMNTATQYTNPAFQDWSATQTGVYNDLQNKINQQFVYDPNTDAALQSQKALYQAGAKQASQSALESMNERGIMNSSLTSNQLGQIEQSANTQFNALIPQYQQQAYQQYQDSIGNSNMLLGNAMNLQGNQFNQAITEAELTGSYLPPGAQNIVNQIYGLKAQAEAQGISASDRAGLSSQADGLRSQLAGMGVDISKLGAGTSRANAQVGSRTMQGQQLDYTKEADTRNFNENARQFDEGLSEDQRQYNANLAENIRQYDTNLDYTKVRDAISDQQWSKQFDEQVRQFGMNNALDWAANSISQQNANVNSGQLSLSREKFNYDKTQDAKGGSSSGGSSSSKTPKIDAKSSTDLYVDLVDDITSGSNKTESRELLRLNKDFLTDSDYKKLSDYISEQYK